MPKLFAASSRSVTPSPGRTSVNSVSTRSTALRCPGIGAGAAVVPAPTAVMPAPADSSGDHRLSDAGEGVVEGFQRLPNVLGVHHQGRGEPQHVPVQAAAADEDAVVLADLHHAHRLLGSRRLLLTIAHQLDADHQTLAADVADDGVFLAQLLQAVPQQPAHTLGVAGEVVLAD